VLRIGRNTFYDRENKISMKIPEFKRSRIRIITEFCGILSGFPNQGCSIQKMDMLPYSPSTSTQQLKSCAKTSAQRKQSKTRTKKTWKSINCNVGSGENLVKEKVEDTSTRLHSGIRLPVINQVVKNSTEEDNNTKRNDINNETVYGKEEATNASRGLSMLPPPNNNSKGGIDSVISGSWLIDSQSSSDAGNEDCNNNSTPGIHEPTNDDKILIEEKAVDVCLGLSSKNRLIFISNVKDNNEGKIIVRIQGANLRRFNKYKNCTTARNVRSNRNALVGWVSIPYHPLLYTIHLWSCRSSPDLI
jgi:hypothetical protein